jgi:uncharacterized membrane protein YdbT with pleckstrin-like domain
MGYVERVLSPGEQIAYRAQLHWVLYLACVPAAIVALAGAIAASQLPDGALRSGLLFGSTLAFAASLLQALAVWVRIANTEIVVTDRRVLYKSGLITRRSIEMNLDKVESVLVDQGLLGRMLDYGSVVIRGVGAGLEPVRPVSDPLEFRRRVNVR